MLKFIQRHKKHLIFIHRYFVIVPIAAAWLYYKGWVLFSMSILAYLKWPQWPLDVIQFVEDICVRLYQCIRKNLLGKQS